MRLCIKKALISSLATIKLFLLCVRFVMLKMSLINLCMACRNKEEMKSLESALPEWKRSFIPPSAEVQEVLVRVYNSQKVSLPQKLKFFLHVL